MEAGGDSVLICRVGREDVALPAAGVAEIVRMPDCTRVPNGPPALLGLANLRGAVLPVMSLARLLGIEPGPAGAASRVVVLAGGHKAGLLVDAVATLSRAGERQTLDLHDLLARAFSAHRPRIKPQHGAEGPATAGPAAPRDVLALILLHLANQDYALRLDCVAAVMRVPAALAAVPHTDGAMLGAVAFRGAVLPVVSLRVLLGLEAAAAGPAARILVVNGDGFQAGLLADAVGGALNVPANAIDPVPPVLLRGAAEAQVDGICRLDGGRRLVCLLSSARLFDAATTARLRSRQTDAVPAPSGSEGPEAEFVAFQLGDERYGLPVSAVEGVVRLPELAAMPNGPDFVAGIMNLRGRAIPVIDGSRRFGTPVRNDRSRRVIVLAAAGVLAGFAVDAVSDVLRVPVSELQAAPDVTGGAAVFDRVAIRRGGQMILLVSVEELLRQAGRDILATLARAAAS